MAVPGPLGYQPRRLHPLSPVAGLVSSTRDVLGVLFVSFTSGLVLLLPLGIAVVLGIRYWSWWRFTFGLEHDPEQGGQPVLRVDSGIFERSVRRIPLDRVQRVEELRRWHHRLLGLAVLRVDTAGGGGGGEVDLDALARADAAAVRSQLDHARRGAASTATTAAGSSTDGDGGDEPAAEPVLVRLGTRRLAAAGITGSQLLVMLAVSAWILRLVEDVPGAPAVEDTVAGAQLPRTVLSIIVGVAAFAAVWLALAAAASVLSYHGFHVRRSGRDLLVRRGLLDVRETVVPLRRVQAVRLEQNLLRRAVGFTSVRIVTAGDPERESGQVVVPALRRDEVRALLAVVLPSLHEVPALRPAPPVARRRAVLRRLAIAAVPGMVAVVLVPSPFDGVLAGALLLGMLLLGLDAYRGLGLGRADGVVATRTGSWVRTTWLVPDARAQSVRVRRSYFQRRVQLSTVHLDVAGLARAPRVVDRRAGESATLADEVLATVPP